MWGFPMPDYLEEGGITFLLQRGGHLLLANLGDDGLVVHGGEGEGGAGARSCPPRLGPPGKGGGAGGARGGEGGAGSGRGAAGAGAGSGGGNFVTTWSFLRTVFCYKHGTRTRFQGTP